ncbi:MAG: ATP-binding protein [Pirellulaceae bacterium]
MRSSSVLRRFVAVYIILHSVLALIFLVVASGWIEQEFRKQNFSHLKSMAYLVRNHLRLDTPTLDKQIVSQQVGSLASELELRITVVSLDGEVLADSEARGQQFENHSDRPEIQQARQGKLGTAVRYSESVGRQLCYLAIPFSAQEGAAPVGVVRVAGDQAGYLEIENALTMFLWIFGLSLGALSMVLMWAFTQREMAPLKVFSQVARSIASGKFESVPLNLTRDNEWRLLADAFRQMQQELAAREKRLLEYSQRLEAVLGSMIEGVLAIDPQGKVRLANEAARKMLLAEKGQLLERNLHEVARLPELLQAVNDVQQSQPYQQIEFQTFDHPRKSISARVCRIDTQQPAAVAIVLQDVTEIRHMETMRRDFVANVSHELKTPLASILAYSETLSMGAINDPKQSLRFVAQIESQAKLLEQQIQDLLTLAKVESGEASFNHTCFAVNEICHEAVQGFAAAATAKSIELTMEEADDQVAVFADYDELLIVLNNLLSNAIRYTPEGGKVSLRPFAEANFVVFEMKDTGIGIAPEHQARIFERFYRVDRARSRELGGTGLGLSIVKHLTQALGGTVHLTSKIGQGSSFRVKLPRCEL